MAWWPGGPEEKNPTIMSTEEANGGMEGSVLKSGRVRRTAADLWVSSVEVVDGEEHEHQIKRKKSRKFGRLPTERAE